MPDWLSKLFFFLHRARPSKATRQESVPDYSRPDLSHGDLRLAIASLETYLLKWPTDVPSINNLGVCYMDVGDFGRARQLFDLAYSLDDDFAPGTINRAKMLSDSKQGAEALDLIRHVKSGNPTFNHVNAVYGGLLFNMGSVAAARTFHLKAWLSDFNNLRHANCYLFHSTYDAINESEMASEHLFWAETLNLPQISRAAGLAEDGRRGRQVRRDLSTGKIRIAYWSPDLRNHSIRYFLRPLLENHDRDDFHVLLLHDSPTSDAHTEILKKSVDEFHDVYNCNDTKLVNLLLDLELDILVELAGHSSHNRLNILGLRVAKVQLSALGYPPTTGLSMIDAKIIDRHISTAGDEFHYTEYALPLPTSFWCFDPMEASEVYPTAPARRNGYVTFGCVGNISKITSNIIGAWSEILRNVPRSRLLLRSISFDDPMSISQTQFRLSDRGIDISRVDFRKPEAGPKFYDSYHEIDIVLDTFPFNGGTTTCFATYMGVPVVTISGDSLISRMGKSILSNLGLDHLATNTVEEYAQQAILLASNLDFLDTFRSTVRNLYRESALGNGSLYAKDFEKACKELLETKEAGLHTYRHRVMPLAADTIVRRAYAVLNSGDVKSAKRVIDYALREYPLSPTAHVYAAQRIAVEQGSEKAISYIINLKSSIPQRDFVPLLVTLLRYRLITNQTQESIEDLVNLKLPDDIDHFDKRQIDLYKLYLLGQNEKQVEPEKRPSFDKQVCLIIISENPESFELYTKSLLSRFSLKTGWKIDFVRCDPTQRNQVFQHFSQKPNIDLVLVLHLHVELWDQDVFDKLWDACQKFDLVSFCGCEGWARTDWRNDKFERKHGSFCTPCPECPDMIDLHILGHRDTVIVDGQAVLDGGLIAMRPHMLKDCFQEKDLEIQSTLYEDFWSYKAFRSGKLLAAHCALGVHITPPTNVQDPDFSPALRLIVEELGIDPLQYSEENQLTLSVPLKDMNEAGIFYKALINRNIH